MENEKLCDFVKTYEKFYFEEKNEKAKKELKNEAEKLGVKILHPTKHDKEDDVMNLLKQKKQDIKTIAWKMGVEPNEYGIRTQYYEYDVDALEEFCKKTNNLTWDYNSDKGIREMYDGLLNLISELDITGYGSVYLINSLFFLSGGKVPIYDYYAQVGLKALIDDINPQDVYVSLPPGKEEHARSNKEKKLAMNMLFEYMRQLKILAKGTDFFDREGMYITRNLDRALWVYGHASKEWDKQ